LSKVQKTGLRGLELSAVDGFLDSWVDGDRDGIIDGTVDAMPLGLGDSSKDGFEDGFSTGIIDGSDGDMALLGEESMMAAVTASWIAQMTVRRWGSC
jgi:hypothetical protein